MSTRRGSSTQVASSIPFDTSDNQFRFADVQQALEEIRKFRIYDHLHTTTTASGTLTLDVDSLTVQILEGTATGYNVKLPDATTLSHGMSYRIFNTSTETITIKDGANNNLISLNPESAAYIDLSDEGTVAGEWIYSIISTTATGITSFNVVSETLFTTTSTTPVLITGMEITPIAGRYAVWFSADITIGANNKLADFCFTVDGTIVSDSVRVVQGVSSDFIAQAQTLSIISVNGSETIDVRASITAGDLDVEQRSLLLIRLGQEV